MLVQITQHWVFGEASASSSVQVDRALSIQPGYLCYVCAVTAVTCGILAKDAAK